MSKKKKIVLTVIAVLLIQGLDISKMRRGLKM